jgi:hypothetical protein
MLMASTTHWKLRRLGSRAKRVLERRAGEAPVLAAFLKTLPVKADAFIFAYDQSAKYENTWKREMKEGKGAVAKLVSQTRSWLPLLVRDVPQFDASDFADKPDVPDDVLEDANRLVAVLDEATDDKGKTLDYANDAKTALITDLGFANEEWSEAETADSHYQKLMADVRATAAIFDLELQTFRRSLGHIAGRNDKDYQKLRAERASHADDEDDPNGPTPPAPVKPAGDGSPTNGT